MHGKAARDVLKKLICLAQEAMMDGMGDDESEGGKIADAVKEEAMDEKNEAMEMASDDSEMEDEEEGEMSFDDYKKSEMKRTNKSPLASGRKSAMFISAGPMKKGGKRA